MFPIQGVDFRAGQKVEGPPRFGRLAAKGTELAIGLTPKVDQAVAIEVGRAALLNPIARFSSRPVDASRTCMAPRLRGQGRQNRRGCRDPGRPEAPPSSGQPSGPRPHQRGNPIHVYKSSGKIQVPRPERMTIPTRECIDVDASGSGRQSVRVAGGFRPSNLEMATRSRTPSPSRSGASSDPIQAVLGFRLRAHRTHPSRLAAPSITRTPRNPTDGGIGPESGTTTSFRPSPSRSISQGHSRKMALMRQWVLGGDGAVHCLFRGDRVPESDCWSGDDPARAQGSQARRRHRNRQTGGPYGLEAQVDWFARGRPFAGSTMSTREPSRTATNEPAGRARAPPGGPGAH